MAFNSQKCRATFYSIGIIMLLFLILPLAVSAQNPTFIRGDVNSDGVVDELDVTMYNDYMYSGGTLTCPLASDVDDNGMYPHLFDLLYLIDFVESGGADPPAPFPDCGEDLTSPQPGESCCIVDPIFFPPVDYVAGIGPFHVCAVDIDKDGLKDLAVANLTSDNISLLKNIGSGVFQAPVDYPVLADPRSIATGDLNGDTYIDLVTSNGTSDSISIFFNVGGGSFAVDPAENIKCDSGSNSVFVADLDGDTYMDILTSNFYSDNVSVLYGYGDGNFEAPINYLVGDQPRCIIAADLDDANGSDLIVVVSGEDSVVVLQNSGSRTFTPWGKYFVEDSPSSVCALDLDGNGDLDLAVASWYTDDVSILIGNGDGSFQTPVSYPSNNAATAVCSNDLDGVLGADIAVANHYSDDVSIFLGNNDGTLQDAVNYPAGDGPRGVCSADLDNDGDIDMAVANFNDDDVSVFLNSTIAGGCCVGIRGNTNGDPDEKVVISDVTYLINYLFGQPNGPAPVCLEEGNANGDPDEKVIISDVTYLINYLFGQPNGPEPPPCP